MSYDVRDYGAKGDGVTLSHQGVQKAIDACSQAGGGTVRVPPGRYCCGTIWMKTNVSLHLERGAVLFQAKEASLFPVICKTPFGNLPGHIQALLAADGANGIAVTGFGTIEGDGAAALSSAASVSEMFRPALIFFRDCRDVRFHDVTLKHSSFWTLHLLRCHDVQVRGVTIENNMKRINTDGIDPDGCTNVLISDCIMRCGDDCVVVKSTEGDRCENITVANCVLSTTCAALKVGTEAMGDIRNILFNNCVIRDTNVALGLYMKDGSTYENVAFANMVIESYGTCPLFVDITPRYFDEPRFGSIRNVSFENLAVTSRGRCFIQGCPGHEVENISFRGISWTVDGTVDFASDVKPQGARRVRKDPARINYAVHPYQFTAVDVAGLTLDDVRLFRRGPQAIPDRGVAFFRRVTEARLTHLRPFEVPAGLAPYDVQDKQMESVLR